MRRILILVLLCAVSGACFIGMPRYQAAGVQTVVITTNSDTLRGELLAAMPDYLVVLDLYRIINRIYYPAVTKATFSNSRTSLLAGRYPDSATTVLLRSISTFPQGMTDTLLASVLVARAATGPRDIRR